MADAAPQQVAVPLLVRRDLAAGVDHLDVAQVVADRAGDIDWVDGDDGPAGRGSCLGVIVQALLALGDRQIVVRVIGVEVLLPLGGEDRAAGNVRRAGQLDGELRVVALGDVEDRSRSRHYTPSTAVWPTGCASRACEDS